MDERAGDGYFVFIGRVSFFFCCSFGVMGVMTWFGCSVFLS